jgi:hypothetical protein
MLYYKVKPEYDNLQRYNGKKVQFDGIWIGNELYTHKELDKLAASGIYINSKYFDPINIPKNQVYFFFGARFQNGTCYAGGNT